MGTWNAYGNEYWPADYLIDAPARSATRRSARATTTRPKPRSARCSPKPAHEVAAGHAHPTDVIVPTQEATPETYLGTARGQGWVTGPVAGVHDYGAGHPGPLEVNDFAFSGTWNTAAQPVTAVSNAGIDVRVRGQARLPRAQLRRERPRQVQVLLDGRPISAADAGSDVHNGLVTVKGERLYTLVSLPHDERHRLSLRFAPGVTGYAFTFG